MGKAGKRNRDEDVAPTTDGRTHSRCVMTQCESHSCTFVCIHGKKFFVCFVVSDRSTSLLPPLRLWWAGKLRMTTWRYLAVLGISAFLRFA